LTDSVLDAAVSLTGAKRGFLLLQLEDEPEILSARNLRSEDEKALAYSRTMAREVMDTGRAVLASDAGADPAFAGSRSIRDLRLRSVLCVPLRAEGERMGAVFLDDPEREDAFGPTDRDVAQGLADLAGLVLQQAKLRSRLEESEAALQERTVNLEAQVNTQVLILEEVREQLHARERELAGRDVYGELVGQSEAMQGVFDVLDRVTAASLPVVIEGETGTGKELVARAIHAHGPRAKGPFVGVNCAALPEALLESELFGHVKGAFTGADRDRKGLFVLANGGTLLLDEIGDMPLALQAKLLRALQEGEVRPVGAKASVPVDVRVVCATNRDLGARVEAGNFREDLYYRLRVLPVSLPPLRERKEDIPLLSAAFLRAHLEGEEKGAKSVRLTPGALKALASHDWPGNVRELKNVVGGAAVFSKGGQITNADVAERLGLPREEDSQRGPAGESFRDAKVRFERAYFERLLARTGGNVSAAAREAGLERGYVHRLVKKLGIDPDEFRGAERG
jgi:transcriptional regulator with GAF, ATPase, and Fis domain